MVLAFFTRTLCLLAVVPLKPSYVVNAFVGSPPSPSLFLQQQQQQQHRPQWRTSYGNYRQHHHHHHRGEIGRRQRLLRAETGDREEGALGPAALLKTAVETRKVPAEEVSEALRALAEDSGSPGALAAEDVEGSWELVFSTQLKSGYMPIRELVGFYPSREEASIDATAGPIPLGGMRGQCWWKGGAENELAFTMGAVKLGPFKLGKDKNEVKTYRFFANEGKVLAAKSSAGGFALLSRVAEE